MYRQIVDIPMGTNYVTLVAELFLFSFPDLCNLTYFVMRETDFMLYLSDNNQTVVVEAVYYTSRYLDDLFKAA